MEQTQDILQTSDVFVIELAEQRKAYKEAEREFQEQLQRLLARADRVVLLARVSQKEGA